MRYGRRRAGSGAPLRYHGADALSVVRIDDTELASAVWLPLTTIRQPTRELAYSAAGLLLSDEAGVVHRRLQHELVVRGSTGRVGA